MVAQMIPRLLETPVLENPHAVSVSCGARHSAICTGEWDLDTSNLNYLCYNKRVIFLIDLMKSFISF